MLEPQDRIRFEQLVLPHLDSAANLARWLLRNRADSDDVVQEAMLRAYLFALPWLCFFAGSHGLRDDEGGAPWLVLRLWPPRRMSDNG